MRSDDEALQDHIKKNAGHWRRMMVLRQEPVFQHDPQNYWNRSICYLYCILLGNGMDGIPAAFRYCLNVSGGVYILMSTMFTFILVMPIMYTEVFLGRYTRLANSQLYRMSPIFFGFCVMVFLVNTNYCPMQSMDISIFLIAALKLIINPFYISSCPKGVSGCYDYKINGKIKEQCEYTFIGFKCGTNNDTIRYAAAYIYWSEFRDLHSDYNFLQYTLATIITCFFTMLLSMMGVRILGIFLKGALFINIMVYLIILLLAITTEGSGNGLANIVDFQLAGMDYTELLKIGMFSTINIGLITPTGYMTYAAFTSKSTKMGPGTDCMLICLLNLAMGMFYLIVVHAVGGVLARQMGLQLADVIAPGAGIYYAMIPQFLTNNECPYIFIILFHISNWLLAVIRLTFALHMHILNLYDFFPTLARYHTYVLLFASFVNSGLGILFSVEIFNKVLCPLYYVMEVYLLQSIKLVLMSLMVYYCYGVRRLSDDIHFVTGRRPIKYWRLLWYLYPGIIIGMVALLILSQIETTNGKGYIDLVDHNLVERMIQASCVVGGAYLCMFFSSTFLYVLMGVRASTAVLNMIKPQFFWGPPDKEARIGRKSFAPRSSIRSQPPKKKKRRFRPLSIKQMHERDIAEHINRGRIFLDSMFFTNTSELQTMSTKAYRLFVKKRVSISEVSQVHVLARNLMMSESTIFKK